MQRFCLIAVILFCLAPVPAHGQPYDLLIRGGHVIDPKNEIDSVMDVAVSDGVIARVSAGISASDAERVIDAAGYYVTPGFIDIHTHVFVGSRPAAGPGGFSGAFADGFSSVSPDGFTFRNGITTVVDAGTSGWRNFPLFKEQVIDRSNTRVLAFLNIVGHGMRDHEHNQDLEDMDARRTASFIEEYPDLIVGTKIGHFHGEEWEAFERAGEAAALADRPLLLECHLPELELEELLGRMKPGDIVTHIFGDVHDRASIIDDRGRVRDYALRAREKGILFDVGHGGVSFHYYKAFPALRQGFYPDTFGTDLHRFSMNAGMKDMLNIMSKFLNMGMSLEDVIFRATTGAAEAIRRPDLGHLSEGAVADLAVVHRKEGTFGFIDSGGYKMEGDQKLEVEVTLRNGRVVWDLNGLTAGAWDDSSVN